MSGPNKQLFHPDGILRMECCPKCEQPRCQDTAHKEVGYDPIHNWNVIAFDMVCPDCEYEWSMTVPDIVAQRFAEFQHAQSNVIKFTVRTMEDESREHDLNMLIELINNDHIVPEDF